MGWLPWKGKKKIERPKESTESAFNDASYSSPSKNDSLPPTSPAAAGGGGSSASAARAQPRADTLLTPCYRGDVDAVEELLAAGSTMDASDALGNSPLHLAAFNGHVKVVKMLLAAGADPNVQNGEQDTPIYMAVLSNNMECVKVIAEKDVQFNCANVEGFTPLHYAAGEGNLPITQYLVEACECDPEAPDNLGLTPGFCAVLQGRVDVAEYLLQISPAGGRARNMASDTILHCALKAQASNRRLLEILIDHHTDIRAVGADRISCEDMLNSRGYADLVERAKALLPEGEADATGATGGGEQEHGPKHFPWLKQYMSAYIDTHADGIPAKPLFSPQILQDEWEFVKRS
mmetsp:Transcript_47049/g.112098  ORF Transcript_47049/g.112098 Transcript_47049/m.112098 type:complete len:348 (+) Transcript_47049:118-1161(+)